MLQFALRAYRLEHGAYPEKLEQLTPIYLSSIPADPFGGEALHYKKQGDDYKLWSIGSDGKDDNARPIENKSVPANSRRRFQIETESQGDIVAGVNY
jgi:hypothetical protein